MAARPYLWCKLIWTSFDFASDSRACSEGGTPGRNDKGLVTYDRQIRKDAFYWYKANWTTEPMVYITGHTFTNRQTNARSWPRFYANCDFGRNCSLNGSFARQSTTSTNCIFTWPMTLQPGTNLVQAVGTKDGINVTDSLIWMTPIPPPGAAIISPKTPTIYLNDPNATLPLSAIATDNQTNSLPPLTFNWIQVSGPGTVTFGDTNALNTTASFSANGVYQLAFQAIKGATITTAGLIVVVGGVHHMDHPSNCGYTPLMIRAMARPRQVTPATAG